MIIRSFITTVLAALLSCATAGPQMLIYGNGYVAIPSGQKQADSRTGTDFGRVSVPMNEATTRSLHIANRGDQELVITTPFTFSDNKGNLNSVQGGGGEPFSLVSIDSTNLAPGTTTTMVFAFYASSNGQYNTDVSISTNDTSTPLYTIPLHAMAGNNANPTPDSTVASLSTPVVVKHNVKKGFGKVLWTAWGYNLNEILPQKGAMVRCWYSTDPYLELTDRELKNKNVKKFGPFNPETIKTLKLNLKVPDGSGYLFAEIFLTPEGAKEDNYSNNIIIAPISIP